MVVGCPRSGTTLLSVMLDRHSDLAIPPETAFYDEIAPALYGLEWEGLRSLLSQWTRLKEFGLTADEVLIASGPEPTRARLLATILGQYARKRGKVRLGEKTPQHLPHVPDILSDFPEARIVCMIRDGRDVVLSLQAMPWWVGGLDAAIATWLCAEANCAAFEKAFPGRFTSIRYEDLVGEPEKTMKVVMAFFGLCFQPAQLDPGVSSGVVLDRSRDWKGEALLAPDPRGIGRRWRNADPAQIEALERALRPALERRGYAPLR